MSEKEEFLDRIIILEELKRKKKKFLKHHEQRIKNKEIYNGFRLKSKRIFIYLICFMLILLFMISPVLIVLLLLELGL